LNTKKGKAMKTMFRLTASACALAFLSAGCVTRSMEQVAGGSVIVGTGLDDARPQSKVMQALAGPGPQIVVVELRGEAQAGRAIKAGDRFLPSQTYVQEAGIAVLRLPGERTITVTGPARLQFSPVDGLLAPLVESGQVDSKSAGRVATPQIAALLCDGSFRVARTAAVTSFECSKGTLRWTDGDSMLALSDAKSWVLDEAQRSVTQR
jgi:hypothetical protein